MKRRFKQLLNLYLDGQLDPPELLEFKHLLALSTENQKEFQRQSQLQAAMKQMSRVWDLPEPEVKRRPIGRIPLSMAAMAALAIFGSLLWIQALNVSSLDKSSLLSSVESSRPHFAGGTLLTDYYERLLDLDLGAMPQFTAEDLGSLQLLDLESHVSRQRLFESAEWSRQPGFRSPSSVERVLSRAWQVPEEYTKPPTLPASIPAQPFVQPASFRFP
jgi:hypothetical protein